MIRYGLVVSFFARRVTRRIIIHRDRQWKGELAYGISSPVGSASATHSVLNFSSLRTLTSYNASMGVYETVSGMSFLNIDVHVWLYQAGFFIHDNVADHATLEAASYLSRRFVSEHWWNLIPGPGALRIAPRVHLDSDLRGIAETKCWRESRSQAFLSC